MKVVMNTSESRGRFTDTTSKSPQDSPYTGAGGTASSVLPCHGFRRLDDTRARMRGSSSMHVHNSAWASAEDSRSPWHETRPPAGSGGVTGDTKGGGESTGNVAPYGWTEIGAVRYVWDGWNLLAELDASGVPLRKYAWGLDLSGSEQGAGGIGGLLFETDWVSGSHGSAGPTYHALYDGNGNLMSLRDISGNKAAAYEYGPFGEILTIRGSYATLNPFRFSTKFADAETGLLYYGYRYLNTSTGRWLSRDSAGEGASNCLYSLVSNQPTSFVDLLGLCDTNLCSRSSSTSTVSPPSLYKRERHERSLPHAGISKGDWATLPDKSWNPYTNGIVSKIYLSYAAYFHAHPNTLPWSGAASFAITSVPKAIDTLQNMITNESGAQLSGLLPTAESGPGPISNPLKARYRSMMSTMLKMARAIYDDLGWQHEAYVTGGIAELRSQYEMGNIDSNTFLNGWCQIEYGNVRNGHRALLLREQQAILQPSFDTLDTRIEAPLMSRMAEGPIPGHTVRFSSVVCTGGNVTEFASRWRWVDGHVFNRWLNMSPQLRESLVPQ